MAAFDLVRRVDLPKAPVSRFAFLERRDPSCLNIVALVVRVFADAVVIRGHTEGTPWQRVSGCRRLQRKVRRRGRCVGSMAA